MIPNDLLHTACILKAEAGFSYERGSQQRRPNGLHNVVKKFAEQIPTATVLEIAEWLDCHDAYVRKALERHRIKRRHSEPVYRPPSNYVTITLPDEIIEYIATIAERTDQTFNKTLIDTLAQMIQSDVEGINK